jgi:hypothetical protein
MHVHPGTATFRSGNQNTNHRKINNNGNVNFHQQDVMLPNCVHPGAPRSMVFFPFNGKSSKDVSRKKKNQSNPDAIYVHPYPRPRLRSAITYHERNNNRPESSLPPSTTGARAGQQDYSTVTMSKVSICAPARVARVPSQRRGVPTGEMATGVAKHGQRPASFRLITELMLFLEHARVFH